MELHPVDPDSGRDLARLADVLDASREVDSPWQHPDTLHSVEMSIRHGWDGEPGRWFLAVSPRLGDIGHLAVFTSSYDNLELAWLWPSVRPEVRRRGLGSDLLRAAYDECRAMGRPLVGMAGWEGANPAGFAQAHGFDQKSRGVLRRQHLAEVAVDHIDRLHAEAEAQAGDYVLERYAGAVPDSLLPALAELTGAINDAPLDDLELEDEVFPPERIRAYERAQLTSGQRLRRVVARHRATGDLAGHTVVAVDSTRPHLGDQHDTAVARDHRGHRLGLLLKTEMLRWLREEEPQVATIDTYNAESNDQMVRVNELLGYRVMAHELAFQRRI